MEFLLILTVATDTPSHIHCNRLIDRVHATDVTMAGCTGDARADVRRVHKMYIGRLLIDPDPGNRLFVDVILPHTGDLWMGHGDIFVTAPANFHGWIVSVSRICRRPVTIGTGNVQLTNMDMVIKRNRLGRTRRTDPIGLALMGSLGPEESHAKRCWQYQTGNQNEADEDGAAHTRIPFSKANAEYAVEQKG